jgi:tRNA modification GTPase
VDQGFRDRAIGIGFPVAVPAGRLAGSFASTMIGDTILARASAAGGSERAIVRISGPRARDAAALVFAPSLPAQRATVEGHVHVRGRSLAAFALSMPAPHSFTGEDVVELHVPGGALLVQSVLDALLVDGAARGVRLALPGEFTARAVQHGKLAPAAVEGLLLLLHAADQREAAAALSWLRGGAAAEVATLRARLQDVLALLEAGLDFGDGETGEVPRAQWHAPLGDVHARLKALATLLPAAAPGGEVLLLGRANAGKSSLANALAGSSHALVDATAGTTRDLLRIELPGGGALWDAPGDLDDPAAADAQALAMRERLGGGAQALLLVLDANDPFVPPSALASPLPWLGIVWTKCDRTSPPPLPPALAARVPVPVFATSAHSGDGLDALREHLARAARAGVVDAGGPLRLALAAATAAVERALASDAPELVAVDLQAALRALDGIAGEHAAEHVLDRIYARFCLGK